MMIFQQQPDHDRRRRGPVRILLLLLLAAIALWVLSTMNVGLELWAPVLNAIFTGLGTILALLQWHTQAVLGSPCATMLPTPDKVFPHEQFVQGIANKRKGAILVYASQKWRGTTLYLLPGLEGTTWPIEAASNVVEHSIGEQRQFLGYFPAIPPGHYTLVALSRQRRVQVTVWPGHLSEIDWR